MGAQELLLQLQMTPFVHLSCTVIAVQGLAADLASVPDGFS